MDLSTANLFTSTTGARGWDGKNSISATDTASNFSFDVCNPPSGLPSQDDSMGSTTIASSSNTRAKTGCITCRLRKKRCDEGKPKCAACDRLGIECLGYGAKRPKWLRDENNAKRAKLEIKEKVSRKRTSKIKSGVVSQSHQEDASLPTSWGASAPANEGMPSGIWEIDSDDGRTWDHSLATRMNGTTTGVFGATSTAVTTTAPTATSPPFMTTPPFNLDPELDDVWRMLFGQPEQTQWQDQIVNAFTPGPSAGPSTSLPNQNYLHHYLNVVLPLQYRFTGSLSIGELVAPLAIAKTEVLTSVSSLAALHMSVKRNKAIDPTTFLNALSLPDDDAMVAVSAHQDSIERLRFISSSDFTAEDIILSAMFAVSYHTFMGGTSKEWKEVLAISQRCLSAALASSPELTGGRANPSVPSPWQRYRQLVEVMIWMDIIASVSLNRVSRLLPTYRNLLGHLPVMSLSHPKLSMERVMGGDSTTLLAMAETVALSEWKERAEEAGYSNAEQLKQRAAPIAKLLSERAWREAHFDEAPVPILMPGGSIRSESEEESKMRVMSDVFYGAANLFLASVVHGPYPRVSEIAAAVQDIIEALHRLDILQANPDINRALIFPITLAGCLCETPSQQAFFRSRFQQLSPEASAFGNTRPALQLMEEVWLRRTLSSRGGKVDWRAVMMEKWEAGILLI